MLKPNMSYSFNKKDDEFILELSKIGHVHKLSNQVTLITLNDSRDYPAASLSFAEHGDVGCKGLVLPNNWVIEYVSFHNNKLSITFGIDNK